MRKLCFIAALIMIFNSNSFSQTSDDTIKIRKVFGGYQFIQNDKKLRMGQLVTIMQPNEQAYKQIKSAQSNKTFADILGVAGGFLIGWPLGTAIGGGDPNWALAGVGAGLVVVSIPIMSKANKWSIAAIETYNRSIKTGSFQKKPELHFAFKGNSIGLVCSF